MLVAQLVGLSWRVQRISEKHQPVNCRRISSDVGGYASAHRLPADNHALGTVFGHNIGDHRPVSGLKFRLWIGHSALLIDVVEVELNREEAAGGQVPVEVSHEGGLDSLP